MFRLFELINTLRKLQTHPNNVKSLNGDNIDIMMYFQSKIVARRVGPCARRGPEPYGVMTKPTMQMVPIMFGSVLRTDMEA